MTYKAMSMIHVDPSNILRYALYIATLFIASTVSIALALGFIQISSYTRQAYLSFREFIYSRTSVDNSHKLDRIQGRVEEIYDIVSEIREQNRQILRDSSITITPPIPPLPDILVTPPSPQGQQLTPSRPTYPLPTTPSTPDTTRTPFPGGFNIPSYIPASPTGATDGSNSPGIQQFYMEGSSYRGIVGVQMSPARGPSLSPLWVPLQTPPFHYGILYPGNFTPQDHSTPAQTSYPLPGREQEPPSAQPPSSNSSKVQSQVVPHPQPHPPAHPVVSQYPDSTVHGDDRTSGPMISPRQQISTPVDEQNTRTHQIPVDHTGYPSGSTALSRSDTDLWLSPLPSPPATVAPLYPDTSNTALNYQRSGQHVNAAISGQECSTSIGSSSVTVTRGGGYVSDGMNSNADAHSSHSSSSSRRSRRSRRSRSAHSRA